MKLEELPRVIIDTTRNLGGLALRRIGRAINPWPLDMEALNTLIDEIGAEYETD